MVVRCGDDDVGLRAERIELRLHLHAADEARRGQIVILAEELDEGLERVEAGAASFGEWTAPRRRQLASLMHPEHLGRAFRVLVQTKES